LIFQNNALQLVAVKKAAEGSVGMLNGFDPCNEGDKLHFWQMSEESVFSSPNGKKSCLTTDAEDDGGTLMTSDVGLPCTINNNWDKDGHKGWFFNEEESGRLCMDTVPDADSGLKRVEGGLKVLTEKSGQCSSSWTKEVFNPHRSLLTKHSLPLQFDLLRQASPECTACAAQIGNFACVLGDCFLAGSESYCEDYLKGEWCSPPPPKYPLCANGTDDWAGNSHRRPCSAGCSYDICEQKKGKDAVDHCYTKSQGQHGIPRGCNYGSDANTCALDANDNCVYSHIGSFVAV